MSYFSANRMSSSAQLKEGTIWLATESLLKECICECAVGVWKYIYLWISITHIQNKKYLRVYWKIFLIDRVIYISIPCVKTMYLSFLSWLLRWVMTIIFPVTKVKADVIQRSQKWNQITHERPSRLNMLHCSAFHKPPEVNLCFLLQLWGSAFCCVLDSVQPPTHHLQTLRTITDEAGREQTLEHHLWPWLPLLVDKSDTG